MIRKAIETDITAIKIIVDANRDTLGFIMRPALQESLMQQTLLVDELDHALVGFCRYHHRRDQQTTLYEICIDQAYRGQGIGRLLIEAVRQEAQGQGKVYI